jgi:hypothetical protein
MRPLAVGAIGLKALSSLHGDDNAERAKIDNGNGADSTSVTCKK